MEKRTEVVVKKARAALRKDRKSLEIEKRLYKNRDADTILVMENGKIVEQGNHKSLLAAEGAYYRLYMSQFAGSDVEDTVVDDSTAVHS